MMKFFVFLTLIFLNGCLGTLNFERPEMMPLDAQTKFTFDYKIDGVSKKNIWKRARDFFAGAYGDSRAVFRVMDESDGTIIGKGLSAWSYVMPGYSTWVCHSSYHIRFAAKDNKARLQLEIMSGSPSVSKCSFDSPTQEGYEEIRRSFEANSKALKKAIQGKGSSSDLHDF